MKILKFNKSMMLVMSLFVMSAQAIATPVVSFDISDNDIQVNEAFSVDVLVDGVDPFDEVFAFGFDLDLDSTWSLSSVTIGPAFDNNDSDLFPDTDVAGSMDFFNFGPSGDNILLASLQLSASSAGIFDLGIISDLFDLNEGLHLFSNTFDLTHLEQVTINSPAATTVPIPGTVWLFGLGATLITSFRFRRVAEKS